jgi:DNA invertase Pin-like site-specific DNA recombinase
MVAAIYARKSTEQNGIADEQKSVARQIDHGRAYAAGKGWTVRDDLVFADDGISGAEFANRPGFVRLMNALKPRPQFQALIMSEESRLGREAIETAYALKQLVTAGVRVFFYLEDRERTLDSPTDKILLSLTAFADELERVKARQRTYDALSRKARAGHVTGGRAFGYDNVDVLTSDGRRSHVERRVRDDEAVVIRRIFTLSADGLGMTSIAKRLNAEGALSPRAQRGRPQAWAPSSVREVLYRSAYRGEITWNKTQKRNQWGVVATKDRGRENWITVPAPQLRIVSDELWAAAHQRLSVTRERYLRGTAGQRWGRPPGGQDSQYLLPGLARCGVCGGSLYVKTKKRAGGARAFFYGCTSFHLRGRTVCTNSLEIPMELADQAVLGVIEREILQPDIVESVVERALELLQPAGAGDARRREVRQALDDLRAELDRLTGAIASGGQLPALLNAIKEREESRAQLEAELRTLSQPAATPDAIRLALRGRLTEWRSVLLQRLPDARQVLRTLLTTTIPFTPHTTPRKREYAFTIEASLASLVGGITGAKMMASPPSHWHA